MAKDKQTRSKFRDDRISDIKDSPVVSNPNFMVKELPQINIYIYIGVLLDEHLHWNGQIAQLKMKLNYAICIFRKLRHDANWDVLNMIYHSLFSSHQFYGSKVRG